MSYEEAFAAVPGVTVEWCEYCGCYQGRLIAKIRIEGNPDPQYILDYYGSCSGCDSFEAEFSYGSGEETPERLAAFGKPYVDASMSLDQVLQELLPKPGEWYSDDIKEALAHVLKDYPEKAALLTAMPEGSA
jgi:hypothetical protein